MEAVSKYFGCRVFDDRVMKARLFCSGVCIAEKDH